MREGTHPYMGPSHHIELSEDAALVAALAGTAMPFSHSAEDQAERWLRALRLHGKVGAALQGLGVGEAPLTSSEAGHTDSPPLGGDAVDRVVASAREHAKQREASVVCTPHLLLAVLDVYGELMERSLQMRGSSGEELVQRLAGHPVGA